jgi:hypothetical protein
MFNGQKTHHITNKNEQKQKTTLRPWRPPEITTEAATPISFRACDPLVDTMVQVSTEY